MLFWGCATVPRTPSPHPAAKHYLKDVCLQQQVEWEIDSIAQTVLIHFGQAQARGLIGSHTMIVNGREIYLSRALKREDNAIVVPPDFSTKVIEALKILPPGGAVTLPRIVIDAGHGGRDPGAIGCSGLYEKEVVLDVSRRLAEALRQKGFTVKMTRRDDRFLTLEERTEITSEAAADMFVSIHANSCPERGPEGIEVFYLRDLTWEEKKEPQRLRNHHLLYKRLQMERGDQQTETIVADMLYQSKKELSAVLADHVARGLSRTMRVSNRGAKDAAYFVLRNTLVPAILVEVGFLSNRREEGKLKSKEYRQRLADGLAESLYTFSLTRVRL